MTVHEGVAESSVLEETRGMAMLRGAQFLLPIKRGMAHGFLMFFRGFFVRPSGSLLAIGTGGALLYIFFRSLLCSGGFLGCGMAEFGVIFPLHLLFSGFHKDLDFPSYVAYFAIATSAYVYLAYLMGAVGDKGIEYLWRKFGKKGKEALSQSPWAVS